MVHTHKSTIVSVKSAVSEGNVQLSSLCWNSLRFQKAVFCLKNDAEKAKNSFLNAFTFFVLTSMIPLNFLSDD